MTVYETEDGQPIITQSMMKTFRQCPREAYYKYVLRLKPKVYSTPLTRGKWIHALLEVHYKGGDWKEEHAKWVSQYRKLFDEEKEKLGDLPQECARLMRGYLWHYGDPRYQEYGWKVHEVEMTLETDLPNGHLFRGRVDLLVEDDFGLWIVDHKTHKRLPDWDYRLLDEQSPLYIWAARQMGIPVRGFMWNYIATSGMSTPTLLKDGKRFSKRLGDTDYPTYAQAVKQARKEAPDTFLSENADKDEVKRKLAQLKAERWNPYTPNGSPFFRRDILEKDDDLLQRVVETTCRTSERLHSYDFTNPDRVERNVDSCKGFMCSYKSLTMGDLLNGDSTMTMKRDYVQGDPMAYYGEEERLSNG